MSSTREAFSTIVRSRDEWCEEGIFRELDCKYRKFDAGAYINSSFMTEITKLDELILHFVHPDMIELNKRMKGVLS
ncbi:hypothetical protein [Butyrivibrio sp. JL13D10]|uniref:hypothetical protein n=1 Tax=Butyrivibrio sp. JL13D10 TaxID=3236815 RepID=UPI0038B602FE